MMLIRILFWFIVFYSLFKLLIRVVLPILINKTIRHKVKDMREHMSEFDNKPHTSNTDTNSFAKKQATASSKGDYIEFEEVK